MLILNIFTIALIEIIFNFKIILKESYKANIKLGFIINKIKKIQVIKLFYKKKDNFLFFIFINKKQ